MPNDQRTAAGQQVVKAFTQTMAKVTEFLVLKPEDRAKMMKGFKPEQVERMAKSFERIIDGRTSVQMEKLSHGEKWGILVGIQDAQYRARGPLTVDIYMVFANGAMIIDTNTKGNTATLVVENRLAYRRQRSEVILVKEGKTWRLKNYHRNAVGKLALGPNGLTVSVKEKKAILALVRQMIVKPKVHYGKPMLDLKKIKAIGPVAAGVAMEILQDDKAPASQKQSALKILIALAEEGQWLLPRMKKMLVSGDATQEETALAAIAALRRAGGGAETELLAVLKHKKRNVALGSATILAKLESQVDAVLPVLLKAMADSPKDHKRVVGAFAEYGEAAAAAVKPLAALLKNKTASVRSSSLNALLVIGKPSLAALPAVRAAVKIEKDNSARIRMEYMLKKFEAMARIGKGHGTGKNPHSQ